jgi:hypothetical protein
MLHREAERQQREEPAAAGPESGAERGVLPRLVPQAEALVRVEARVAAPAARAQAVAATQRLGLVPERREPVP